ncbi:hypothetical protein [Nostoc sp. CALU 546]|uniref:hypothetical protein n=1 Tax=Nostoc sp. CALU 546 TaxID=1867241 RepID=UPI003B68210E
MTLLLYRVWLKTYHLDIKGQEAFSICDRDYLFWKTKSDRSCLKFEVCRTK